MVQFPQDKGEPILDVLLSHSQTDTKIASLENGTNDQESTSFENYESSGNSTLNKKNSFCMAFFNVVNQLEGLGLLGIPYAFRVGSWYTALLLVIVAFGSCTTGKLLSYSLYNKHGTRVRRSYHEIAEASFGRAAKYSVVVFQIIGFFGIAVTFLILIASSLMDIVPWKLTQLEATGISMLACLPFLFFQRLSYVAYISFVSVAVLVVIVIAVPTISFINITAQGNNFTVPPVLQPPTLANFQTLGLLIFAFSAHSSFAEHENSMKEPSKFPAVLNLAFAAITIEKLFFGIVAWLAFGDSTQEIVTLNLKNITGQIVSACIGLNTLFTLPLIVVICFRIIGSLRAGKLASGFLFVERIIALVVCGFCAAFLKHFALLMTIFGSLAGTFLVFMLPTAMYLRLHGQNTSFSFRSLYVIVGLFGTLGGTFSLVLATQNLIEALETEANETNI